MGASVFSNVAVWWGGSVVPIFIGWWGMVILVALVYNLRNCCQRCRRKPVEVVTPVVTAPPPPPRAPRAQTPSRSRSPFAGRSSVARPNLPVGARAKIHIVPYRVEYFSKSGGIRSTEFFNPLHGGVTIRRNLQRVVIEYLASRRVTLQWGDFVSFGIDRFGKHTGELTVFNGRDIVSMDFTDDKSAYRLPQCMTIVTGGPGCPPNFWSEEVVDQRVWFNACEHRVELMMSKPVSSGMSRARADREVWGNIQKICMRRIRIREVVYDVWYVAESQLRDAMEIPSAIPCSRHPELENCIFLGEGWTMC